MDSLPEKLRQIRQALRAEYFEPHGWPWIIGFSGGKDSTLLAHLVIEMLQRIAPDERRRRVLLVSNNTLVESPVFQSYVSGQLSTLRENLAALRLPVEVVETHPQTNESFWFHLLGKGYPAPSPSFRWCTNHMKLKPTARFLREQVTECGGAILLLGIRRSESQQRAKTIAAHEAKAGPAAGHLTAHTDVPRAFIFAPLKEMTTEEVWTLLLQLRPPWGGSHRALIDLYRDAHSGECPFVVTEDDKASCGTSNARFGCWTCTVVKKDRALDALAELSDDDALEKLSAFRIRLKKVSDDADHRLFTRRNGQPGPGPLKITSRELLLNELLALQVETNRPLISDEEVRLIRAQWRQDETTEIVRSLGTAPATI
jgi:DNA sulfur modification protein DndC